MLTSREIYDIAALCSEEERYHLLHLFAGICNSKHQNMTAAELYRDFDPQRDLCSSLISILCHCTLFRA